MGGGEVISGIDVDTKVEEIEKKLDKMIELLNQILRFVSHGWKGNT